MTYKIDYGELSQILGEQFRLFGHQLKGSFSVPNYLKSLADGGETIVSMSLVRGSLRLAGYDEVYAVRAENKLLQRKVKDRDAEIKALNILLKEQEESVESEKVGVEQEEVIVQKQILKSKTEKNSKKRVKKR